MPDAPYSPNDDNDDYDGPYWEGYALAFVLLVAIFGPIAALAWLGGWYR